MASQIDGWHMKFSNTDNNSKNLVDESATPLTHSLTIGLISFSIQYFFLVFVLLAYIGFAVGKILIQETFWRCKLFKNANATLLVVIVLKIVECESHAAAREAKCLLDRM